MIFNPTSRRSYGDDRRLFASTSLCRPAVSRTVVFKDRASPFITRIFLDLRRRRTMLHSIVVSLSSTRRGPSQYCRPSRSVAVSSVCITNCVGRPSSVSVTVSGVGATYRIGSSALPPDASVFCCIPRLMTNRSNRRCRGAQHFSRRQDHRRRSIAHRYFPVHRTLSTMSATLTRRVVVRHAALSIRRPTGNTTVRRNLKFHRRHHPVGK